MPTREAARSIAAAEDFIACSDLVSVVTVEAKPDQNYGQQPGADIISSPTMVSVTALNCSPANPNRFPNVVLARSRVECNTRISSIGRQRTSFCRR